MSGFTVEKIFRVHDKTRPFWHWTRFVVDPQMHGCLVASTTINIRNLEWTQLLSSIRNVFVVSTSLPTSPGNFSPVIIRVSGNRGLLNCHIDGKLLDNSSPMNFPGFNGLESQYVLIWTPKNPITLNVTSPKTFMNPEKSSPVYLFSKFIF